MYFGASFSERTKESQEGAVFIPMLEIIKIIIHNLLSGVFVDHKLIYGLFTDF